MPRRNAAEKRERKPDHKYNDITVAQFVNSLMIKGKKSTAESRSTSKR